MATHEPIKSVFATMAIGLGFTLVGCVNSPDPNIALYERPVIYAGLGLGASQLEVNDDDFNQTDSSSVAGQLTFGLEMAQSWGFELRVADLGEAKFEDGLVLGYQVTDISAFGKLPLTPRASVFARLGAGTLSNSGSDFQVNRQSSSHAVIGAGINYDLSQHFSLRADFSGHDVNARHALLSLIYRFNPRSAGSPAVNVAPAEPSVVDATVTDSVKTAPTVTAPTVTDPTTTEPTAAVAVEEPSQPAIEPRPTITRKPEIAKTQTTPARKPVVKAPKKQPRDADRDGVNDPLDDCPETAAAEPVNASGCALFGPVVPGVVFDEGSASLNVGSMTALDAIVASLKTNPEMRVIVGAYGSQNIDSASDLLLSRRRTIAVIRYLRAEGIDAARMQPDGNALEAESTNSSFENRIGIRRK